MPWNGVAPNQTFGRTDGTRTGDTTWQQAKAAGENDTAVAADTHDTDLKDGVNACLKKDGGNTATSNIPMGGFKLTGHGNASSGTDVLNRQTADARYVGVAAETDVASAGTTDLGAISSTQVRITGTTTITSFGTVAAGIYRQGRFAGALTLTHNATSLILPGGASITTAANDRFGALSLGSGNWIVLWFQSANSPPLTYTPANKAGETFTGSVILETTNPNLQFHDTSGASDAKRWNFQIAGGNLQFYTLNDAQTLSEIWLSIIRSGIDVTAINFTNAGATGLQRDGNVIWDQSNVGARINALTEDATPDTAADFALTYDVSATAAKKVKLDKFGPSAGSSTPLASGTAAAGTTTVYAREDHKHPFSVVSQATGSGPLASYSTSTGVLTVDFGIPPGTCFPAGSMVLMADGTEKEISTVEAGDLVWSPNGPAVVEKLDITQLGKRTYWRMMDSSIYWSDEHSFVVDRDGDIRLWSMNVDRLMEEADNNEIGGLDDWEWMYEGAARQGEFFLTTAGRKINAPVRVRNGAKASLPLYLPMTANGELISVNGYIVGAGIDGSKCDYRAIDWKAVLAER
jgi:hypothetical protein